MKEIKLPEKLYFSLEEIAERWECDEGTVRHYIKEGMLRPAVDSSELHGDWALFEDFSGVDTWPGDELKNWRYGYEDLIWQRATRSQKIYRRHSLPRFMYINGLHLVFNLGDELFVTVLENIEGKEFGISRFAGLPLSDESPAEFSIRMLHVTNRYNSPWITREERDRFERGSEISQANTTRSEAYMTPYMEVMRDAVAEFFEPRHDVDPKKAEVVDWVNTRLAKKGLASDNIAQAIFTIIKPTDHDPRKRRG